MNGSVIDGALQRERRELERMAVHARWVGLLAQVDPRKQPSVDRLMGNKPVSRLMAGKEIGSAMRAWARRMG